MVLHHPFSTESFPAISVYYSVWLQVPMLLEWLQGKQTTKAILVVACALHATRPGHATFTNGDFECDFPDRPLFPERPVCPPTTLTAKDAQRLAWRCAPSWRQCYLYTYVAVKSLGVVPNR